ncbi:MAG TPA: tetratricopeptide repeat protein [Acidobacteriaceae bacterium]|nr:tetratricopeptide repeat protein [Acidobacteriaceae bacterium]
MRSSTAVLLAITATALSAPLIRAQSLPASGLSAQDLPAAIHQQEILLQQPTSRADALAWWKLARLNQDAARYPDAQHAYTQALALLQNGDRATLADVMDGLGTLYAETGDYAHAEPLETQALTLREALGDRTGEGRSWMHLAMLSLGRHDIASAAHDGQLATQRLLDPSIPSAPEEQMTALIDLALVRCAQNLPSAAIPLLKNAHRIAQTTSPAGGFPAAFTEFLLGYANWRDGNLHAAATLMKRGAAGLESQLGPQHPTYISAMAQYATFLDQTHHTAEASELRAHLASGSRLPPLSPAALTAQLHR